MQTTEQLQYYEVFDMWFDNTEYPYSLKYDPRMKKEKRWYQYEAGVFKPVSIDIINTIVFDWDLRERQKLSNAKLSFLIKRMQAKCLLTQEWDADPNIDNCLNGLVDKNRRKLLPHTYDYPSLEQIQRNYHEECDGIIPALFDQLLTIIPDGQERNYFIKFCINIVHKNFDDELFCMLYGPKGGGKSTILQLFGLMFGTQNVSKTLLHKFGKRFGLKEMYNKRLNVNPDLPIVPMSDHTIAILKQLTGNDGPIEVELKGTDSFQYPVRCFLIFGINQLMGFKATSEQEIESIFRRALLIHLPTTLKRNTKFKHQLQDSEFLDELYSWLVWMRPLNILDDDSIEWWVNMNKRKWLTNSNPILAICKSLYVHFQGGKLGVRDVQDEVRAELENDGKLTSHQLQTNITQALQTMKIYRDSGRGSHANYRDIKRISQLTQIEIDALEFENIKDDIF